MKAKDIETVELGDFIKYDELAEAGPEEENKELQIPDIQPDIIYIMNEAWSDLSVLGNIETNEPVMPYLDSLREECANAISGYCYVEVIGGLNCNSEFEALTGDSLFNMNVTTLPYNTMIKKEDSTLTVLSINGEKEISNENRWYLEGYLDNIRETDRAMQSVFEYFEKVDTPTIICMFGDHQPLFPEELYEQLGMGKDKLTPEDRLKKYMTPYIIWSNYDMEWKEYGDFSLNYLSPILLSQAGYSLPTYYQFLLELKEEYPVLTLNGCYDKEMNFRSPEELKDEDMIKEYHYLEYTHVVEDGKREIFLP